MTKKDTTSTGVSDQPPSDAVDNNKANETEDSPSVQREKTMSNIIDNAKKEREIDIESGPIPGEVVPVYGDDNQTAWDHDDDALVEKKDSNTTRIKVDGVEEEVASVDVEKAGGLAAYQKQRAAANRLREASKKSHEVDQREQTLLLREQQLAEREALLAERSQQTEIDQPSIVDVDKYSNEALADMLYSGDEEEAAKAIRVMRGASSSAPASVNTEEIVNQATTKALWQMEQQQANAEYDENYDDLNRHSILRQEVNSRTVQLMNAHPEWGPRQIIFTAADSVRDEFSELLQQSTNAAETEDRVNRKRATDQVRGASAVQPKKRRTRPPTRSEIVADMQRQRAV